MKTFRIHFEPDGEDNVNHEQGYSQLWGSGWDGSRRGRYCQCFLAGLFTAIRKYFMSGASGALHSLTQRGLVGLFLPWDKEFKFLKLMLYPSYGSHRNQLKYWLDLKLRSFIPELRQGANAPLPTPLFKHAADMLVECLERGCVNVTRLPQVSARKHPEVHWDLPMVSFSTQGVGGTGLVWCPRDKCSGFGV